MAAMLSSQNKMSSWLGRGCSVLTAHSTMDIIVVGPWMLFSQKGVDHAGRHGWAADALCVQRIPPWTHGWAGCSVPTAHDIMDVIIVGPWMLSSQKDGTMDVITAGPCM